MEEGSLTALKGALAGKSLRKSSVRKSWPHPQEGVSPSGSKLLAKRGKEKSSNKRHRDRIQSVYSRRSSSIKSNADGYTAHSGRESVTVVRTRGYSIYRSPSNVEVNIDTATFFGEDQDPCPSQRLDSGTCRVHGSRQSSAGNKSLEMATQRLMEVNIAHVELQTRYEELRIQLEEEREQHKAHTEELEKQFKKDKEAMSAVHKKDLRAQAKKHEEEIDVIQTAHSDKTDKLREDHALEIVYLKAEMRVNEELHSKATVEQEKENEQKIEIMKQAMLKQHDAEMAALEKVLKQDSEEKVQGFKQELSQLHEEELQEMKERHQREMDSMLMQFSRIHELEEELTKSRKQVKKLEKQTTKFKADMYAAHTKQHKIEAQLLQTENELEKFKAEFQNKIRDSQAMTKDRMDDLILENAQLRRKLMLRSEEFSEYRSSIESANARVIRNYKEQVQVLVRARQKANLSVAMGITEEAGPKDKEPRPSSAPVTRRESSKAKRHIMSSEPTATESRHSAMTRSHEVVLRPSSCSAHLTRSRFDFS